MGLEVSENNNPEPRRVNTEKIKIGVISYLVPRKRVDTVLRALKDCNCRDRVELTIIGDGPLKPHLESMVRTLSLSKVVRFLGRMDHFEAKRILKSFHLTIHLDYVPHMVSAAVQESLAAGVPVIFSQETPVTKYREYPYGWQVDAQNPSPLAELLDSITDHKESIKQKSKEALKYARENLSHEVVGKKLLNAYLKLSIR